MGHVSVGQFDIVVVDYCGTFPLNTDLCNSRVVLTVYLHTTYRDMILLITGIVR